jgi:murein DD-endopeptidase MepM/ murein hydrolase activator NlpD
VASHLHAPVPGPVLRPLLGTVLGAVLTTLALVAVPTTASAAVQVGQDSSRHALEDSVKVGLKQPRSTEAKEENAELAKLAASAEQAVAEILENAWKLPLAADVYRLTARFGQCSSLWSHCHTGLDFAAPEGTPILAVANGTITTNDWAGAYGNRTIMTLEDGTEIWYCHQSAFGAKVGEQVVGGQPIGFVGTTGNSTGPHLHLEVRPGGGDAVDPFQALSVHGLDP